MPALDEGKRHRGANANDPLSFNTGDLDVSAQVTKMKALNPDGVVVSADYSQAVTVIREMKRQGLIKPVVGSTQLISSAILKAAPEIPIVAPATFYATMKGEKPRISSTSCSRCCARPAGLPPEIEPSMYDANIYEIVSIYIDAIKKTGVTGKPEDLEADRTKIRDYMAKLTVSPASAARSALTMTATPSRHSISCRARTERGNRRCAAAARRPDTPAADLI